MTKCVCEFFRIYSTGPLSASMSPGLVGQLEELTNRTMQTFKGSLIRVCLEGGEETEPGATRRAHLYHHLQSKR